MRQKFRTRQQTLAFAFYLLFVSPAVAAVSGASPASNPQKPVQIAQAQMATGGEMVPPAGYAGFCSKYLFECFKILKGPVAVELTAARRDQLETVQTKVNAAIQPTFDPNYVWDYPVDGQGDCNKFALAKRRELLEQGWPRESLLLTVVYTETNEAHLVLVATTSQGDMVLDNRFADVKEWRQLPYRWVERQSAAVNGRWLAIVDQNAPTRMADAAPQTPRELQQVPKVDEVWTAATMSISPPEAVPATRAAGRVSYR